VAGAEAWKGWAIIDLLNRGLLIIHFNNPHLHHGRGDGGAVCPESGIG
jgi:hypothetical protein